MDPTKTYNPYDHPAVLDRKYAAGFGTGAEDAALAEKMTHVFRLIAIKWGLSRELAEQIEVSVKFVERPRPRPWQRQMFEDARKLGLPDMTPPTPDRDGQWMPARVIIKGFDVQLPQNHYEMERQHIDAASTPQDKQKVRDEYKKIRQENRAINAQLKDVRDQFMALLEHNMETSNGSWHARVTDRMKRLTNVLTSPVQRASQWEGFQLHRSITFKGHNLQSMVNDIDAFLIDKVLPRETYRDRLINYHPVPHHAHEAQDLRDHIDIGRGFSRLQTWVDKSGMDGLDGGPAAGLGRSS